MPVLEEEMLVVLTDAQLFPSQVVCQSCLLADQAGLPRWQKGRLCCGTAVPDRNDQRSRHYRCRMGFHLAEVNEHLPSSIALS
jgi:hypothetical protein